VHRERAAGRGTPRSRQPPPPWPPRRPHRRPM
jgi:hypothetical protein